MTMDPDGALRTFIHSFHNYSQFIWGTVNMGIIMPDCDNSF